MQIPSGTPSAIKAVNRNAIMEIIQRSPGITKPLIAQEAGLSLPTVNKIVTELETQGEVIACELVESKGGRPAMTYRINDGRRLVLSVYINRGVSHCYLSRLDGSTLRSYRFVHSKSSWTDDLCTLLEKVLNENNEQKIPVIGVAVPGTVTDGVLNNIPTIPEWEGFKLGEVLQERFGRTVIVENDIKIATVGVFNHCLSDELNNMIYLYMQNSMGAGLVIDRKLYKSRNNFSGELGFLAVRQACARDRGAAGDTELEVCRAIAENDRPALMAITADILSNICCMFDPDLIALDCAALEEEDIPELCRMMGRSLPDRYIPRIQVERMDIDRYIYGLTMLCIEQTQRGLRLVQ